MLNILKIVFASKRAFSFYWRAGVGVGILFGAHLLDVLPDLGLPELIVVIISYIINEVTKWLNKKTK